MSLVGKKNTSSVSLPFKNWIIWAKKSRYTLIIGKSAGLLGNNQSRSQKETRPLVYSSATSQGFVVSGPGYMPAGTQLKIIKALFSSSLMPSIEEAKL